MSDVLEIEIDTVRDSRDETETEGTKLSVAREVLEGSKEPETNEVWDTDDSGECVSKLETLELSEA